MIDVCNIFKPTDIETGNFLMFSQYMRDLSAHMEYQVVPSKFVCLNLPEYNGDFPNIEFPQDWQNYHENNVSIFRESFINDNIPGTSRHNIVANFWGRLLEFTNTYSNAAIGDLIKYVGPINTDVWNEMGGFEDILIDIPAGVEPGVWKFNPSYIQTVSENGIKAAIGYDEITQGGYIEGWSASDNIPVPGNLSAGTVSVPVGKISSSGHTVNSTVDTGSDTNSIFNRLFTQQTTTSPDSFTFNAVLVLYNIYYYTGAHNLAATDVPMGLYITGSFDENGEITNPVTIHRSVSDAYGSGSAWSLRIATRFTASPNGYLKVEEVATESSALHNSISALMSANAEAIKALRSFADASIYNSQTIKDMYSMFKNQRVNVPYIREVNGVPYWFVNGRNTEVPASGGSSDEPDIAEQMA